MARKVSVAVEIDGEEISPISYLSIQQPLHGHHFFEIHCPIREREKTLSHSSEACGKTVKIEFSSGAVGRDKVRNFFAGVVSGVSLSKQHGSSNEVVYYGHGPTFVMDDGLHNQSFAEKKLETIVKEVCGKYSLSPKVDAAFKTAIPYVVQYRESSFNFLSRMAALHGEWFFYNGEDLYFGKAPSAGDPVELVFGRELSSIDMALQIGPAKFKWLAYDHVGHKFPETASPSPTKVSGLDEFGKKMAAASESYFSQEPTSNILSEVADKSGLDELVRHDQAARAGGFVVANCTSDHHGLKVGSIVQIKSQIGDEDGLAQGPTVSYGEFRIIKINHSTDALGNYNNHFKAIPASLTEPPANPNIIMNPVCEMQLAEVLENHDPEGLGRVRVQFQWQKANNDKTPWIRVAATGAGGGYGSFFVPEKNDQVFVGFEFNNPDKPYAIGGLYHGKAKPKGVSDKDNHKKLIQTKAGNKISLDDKGGGEQIVIESGSNSITLAMTGNSITIKSTGDITIDGKNIKIKASENVEITAGINLKLKGENNASMKGTNGALIKGKTLMAVGTDSAELTSNTTTTVSSPQTKVIGDSTLDLNSMGPTTITGSVLKLN